MSESNWAKPSDKKSSALVNKSVIAAFMKTSFVVFATFICFGTVRNSIIWHLERIWEASGDLWQGWWTKVYALFGEDEVLLSFVGTNVVSFSVYWVLGSLYLFVDLTGRPKWALQYKIQDGSNRPLDRRKLMHSLKTVIFNQIVIGGAVSYVLHPVYAWRGCSFGPELPSFHRMLFEIAIFTLVEEVGFYYSHRLLHHPRIYRPIHKIHHEWTAPIGIVSFNAHPLEHLLSNVGPVFLGPFIMGSHITTAWTWLSLALISSINTHSGYHFPFMPSPEAHDFHHLKFTQNFGVLGFLDRLHGTDAMFRKSRAYDRHIMLLGFTPLKQTFPDH
ncbi:hypothetical protein ACROYT_G038185, partial [Oculina patagonica]